MSDGWVALGLSLLAILIAGFVVLRSTPLPLPSGKYPVGSRIVTLDQEGPGEARGERALALRVFFPARGEGRRRAPLMDGRVGRAFAAANGMPSMGGETPSGAFVDVSPIDTEKFPVVLFLHGAMSFADQNASTLIDLASHGFVVMALSHPGESILTVYADGSTRPLDPELSGALGQMKKNFTDQADAFVAALGHLTEAKDRKEAGRASVELGKVYEKLFGASVTLRDLVDARKRHIERVVNVLGDPSRRVGVFGDLAEAIDGARIGITGHSLGAYAALDYLQESGKTWPALALDAPFFSLSGEAPRPLLGPLLGLFAERTKLPNGRVAETAGGLRALIADAGPGDVQLQVRVRGSQHMNFSDMNGLPRLLHFLGVLGPIEGGRAALLVNAATRGFFSEHLRGGSKSWLSDWESQFQEVVRVERVVP